MANIFSTLKKIKAHQMKTALYRYYTAPQIIQFYALRNGFIYFSVGLITVYMANTNMPKDIYQELVTLIGLVLCALGFFIAMRAYIRFVISRFVIFFTRK